MMLGVKDLNSAEFKQKAHACEGWRGFNNLSNVPREKGGGLS